MARMNDDAQWIVLMGFLISFALFFLAIVLNQSVVVGQTTAEGVLDFPKSDIRDFRYAVIDIASANLGGNTTTDTRADKIRADFSNLSLNRKNAVVNYTVHSHVAGEFNYEILLHYSNGVSVYNESMYY